MDFSAAKFGLLVFAGLYLVIVFLHWRWQELVWGFRDNSRELGMFSRASFVHRENPRHISIGARFAAVVGERFARRILYDRRFKLPRPFGGSGSGDQWLGAFSAPVHPLGIVSSRQRETRNNPRCAYVCLEYENARTVLRSSTDRLPFE